MALQINKQLTDSSGGIVLSGSYMTFRTIFDNNYDVIAQPSLYRNFSCFTGGTQPVSVVGIPKVLRYSLTAQQYDTLTPVVMMGMFQKSIEAVPIIGSGSTTIVS